MTSSPRSVAAAHAVGLCLHRPRRRVPLEPFWTQFMRGAERVLADRGFSLTLQVVVDFDEEIATYRRWRETGQIAGVIVADLVDDDGRLPVLRELGLPSLLLAPDDFTADLATVSTEATMTMHFVMEHLAAHGHQSVARVTGPPTFLHTRERDAEFTAEAARLGMRVTTLACDYTADGGASATSRVLALADRPTAVIYDNDVMALAGVTVMREAGLAVPHDIAVIAWDDSIQCQLASPPLTATARDLVAYGALAARGLLDVLDGLPPTHRRSSQPVLVVRASSDAALAVSTEGALDATAG
ncbi:substrate-binding domain-containing protein [Microbacterium sp. STN6]|uniref:LacI family DNA-binding transcriptional regulator n=1 Tax=Microbacterium sp. STN6 TaxID=2995588 RepID=UPI002260D022|nr:substrate-binding domain-containing protein [Microbacterium sp. STN6]MCX7522480.1 substrate-binding domain-containing protein [Microbacterium sp. STN6]